MIWPFSKNTEIWNAEVRGSIALKMTLSTQKPMVGNGGMTTHKEIPANGDGGMTTHKEIPTISQNLVNLRFFNFIMWEKGVERVPRHISLRFDSFLKIQKFGMRKLEGMLPFTTTLLKRTSMDGLP